VSVRITEFQRRIDKLAVLAGYAAFDPQLGRIVIGADITETARSYRSTNEKLPGILPAIQPKRLWWKFW
jgi:hypothetical protein